MLNSWIEAIKDKNTGQTLVEILQGFNMYFLSYNSNTSATRCSIPMILRNKGLWVTYVKYDGNVYTEWYNSNNIDDKSWSNSSNWKSFAINAISKENNRIAIGTKSTEKIIIAGKRLFLIVMVLVLGSLYRVLFK